VRQALDTLEQLKIGRRGLEETATLRKRAWRFFFGGDPRHSRTCDDCNV